MRILNLLVTERGIPRVVESFPIVDEDLSGETIQIAEDVLCNYVLGILYKETVDEEIIFKTIDSSYGVGVQKPSGLVFHLVWSSIPD